MATGLLPLCASVAAIALFDVDQEGPRSLAVRSRARSEDSPKSRWPVSIRPVAWSQQEHS